MGLNYALSFYVFRSVEQPKTIRNIKHKHLIISTF